MGRDLESQPLTALEMALFTFALRELLMAERSSSAESNVED
jgi:hypothetical protein